MGELYNLFRLMLVEGSFENEESLGEREESDSELPKQD